MQRLIDEGVKVDAVVTDPPYHLKSIDRKIRQTRLRSAISTDGAFVRVSKRFMGKEWDGETLRSVKKTWALCFELLKAGGHLLAFSGSHLSPHGELHRGRRV